jgi:hypothetical protein
MFPSIWGNILVWHQEGNCRGRAGSDVMMRNLSSERNRQLTHNHISSEPVTNGKYVAWSQGGSRFNSGPVVLLNLSTGGPATVSLSCATDSPQRCQHPTVNSTAGAPAIGSDVLAWGTSFPEGVFVRDLSTGREYEVRSGGSHVALYTSYLATPWKHNVVWKEARAGVNRPIFGIATVP